MNILHDYLSSKVEKVFYILYLRQFSVFFRIFSPYYSAQLGDTKESFCQNITNPLRFRIFNLDIFRQDMMYEMCYLFVGQSLHIYFEIYIFKKPIFCDIVIKFEFVRNNFLGLLVEQPSSCYCPHFHEFLFVRYICILDFSMNNLFINSNKIDEIIPNNEQSNHLKIF